MKKRPQRPKVKPELKTFEPPIEHFEPPELDQRKPDATDKRFWPADKSLPKVWHKPRMRLLPCPRCRRVLLDDSGQAVVCMGSGSHVAWFRCKACEHRWALPIRRV